MLREIQRVVDVAAAVLLPVGEFHDAAHHIDRRVGNDDADGLPGRLPLGQFLDAGRRVCVIAHNERVVMGK